MNIVGLDQSYTGFGYCTGGNAIKKSFPTSKYPDPVDRLFAVEEWLSGRLHQIHDGIDLVVMEGYANGAKFGREMAGELGWAVKRTVAEVADQNPLIVPPTSLKKFVAGSGGAKKNTMLAHVYKKWGVMFSDDNQADAYALEHFGAAYLNITAGKIQNYLKYEIEAVEAVRKAK